MKFLIFVILSAACLYYVEASVAISPYDPKSNYTSHCYSLATGPMNSGESKRVQNECVMAHCGSNRDIAFVGCGVVSVAPPCKVKRGDLRKPHPECCDDIVCP